MGQRAPTPVLFTVEEYLHWEAGQIERHEFVDGEIFCVSGAGRRHVMVTGNVYFALRQHLRGSPCRTLMMDMKVQVAAAKSYFYPDVFVTCSPANPLNEMVEREPKLIVEVLSPSTANYDRTDKFAAYRQLTSLEEYALVDIENRRADVYRRGSDGVWTLHPFTTGQGLAFASVDLVITADDLFAEVFD